MSISPTGRNSPERHHPTDEQRLASLKRVRRQPAGFIEGGVSG